MEGPYYQIGNNNPSVFLPRREHKPVKHGKRVPYMYGLFKEHIITWRTWAVLLAAQTNAPPTSVML